MYTADKKLIDNVKSLEDEVFPVSEFLTEHPEHDLALAAKQFRDYWK